MPWDPIPELVGASQSEQTLYDDLVELRRIVEHEDSLSILRDGLLPMKRLHVHLSKDIETATKVGNRHVNDDKYLLILKIDAIELNKIHPIYISDNGVYLVKKVPSIFLL